MTESADQLAQAWATNCRINRLLIKSITAPGMECTLSTRGGRGVAGEFAHMHNVRLAHLEKRAKDLSEGIVKLIPGNHPPKKDLLAAFNQSDPAIEQLLVDASNGLPKRRAFKRGIFTTLSYFIAHEAHHRGRILLTLKVSGHTLDKAVQMQIWGWDQI